MSVGQLIVDKCIVLLVSYYVCVEIDSFYLHILRIIIVTMPEYLSSDLGFLNVYGFDWKKKYCLFYEKKKRNSNKYIFVKITNLISYNTNFEKRCLKFFQ